MTIVYLRISTFRGISPGARHYYGDLRLSANKEVSLKKKLTAEEAAHFTECDGAGYTWKAGGVTIRFATEKEVIDLAVATYKDHFPDAHILIKGSAAYASPRPILDGPEGVKEKGAELIARAEATHWWDGDQTEMFIICDEWDALLAEENKA